MSTMTNRQITPAAGLAFILCIAVGGLLYVKWLPYYHRAMIASVSHSIGRSILTAGADQAPAPGLSAAIDYALAYGKAIWQAMLLGLLLGTAVQEFAPHALIHRLLGSRGWRSAMAGALLSIPGMMCTCCAAPVVIGLRRVRASQSAAMAFWLGNTVLNPATLVFMGFVLGWQWSALRLVVGLLIVFVTAYWVDHWSINSPIPYWPPIDSQPTLSGWLRRFARLAAWLIPEYVILILLLGAVRAWLFPHIGPDVDNSVRWILIMAAAGLIFVIPTAGEVPIVQTMLALGVGAGPAAALLVTLPPISLPSLAMTKSVFSYRAFGIAAATVLVLGTLAGLAALALGF